MHDIEADVSQHGHGRFNPTLTVERDQFARFLGRRNQPLHPRHNRFAEHARVDHQSGLVGNVVTDQHQGELITESVTYRLHHPLLMIQQHVHQLLQKWPIIIEKHQAIGDAHRQQCAVEKRGKVGDHADAGALRGAQGALQRVQLLRQRRRRLQILQIGPVPDGPAHIVLAAIGGLGEHVVGTP